MIALPIGDGWDDFSPSYIVKKRDYWCLRFHNNMIKSRLYIAVI